MMVCYLNIQTFKSYSIYVLKRNCLWTRMRNIYRAFASFGWFCAIKVHLFRAHNTISRARYRFQGNAWLLSLCTEVWHPKMPEQMAINFTGTNALSLYPKATLLHTHLLYKAAPFSGHRGLYGFFSHFWGSLTRLPFRTQQSCNHYKFITIYRSQTLKTRGLKRTKKQNK